MRQIVAATAAAGGLSFVAGTKIRIGRGPLCRWATTFLHRFASLALKSRIDAGSSTSNSTRSSTRCRCALPQMFAWGGRARAGLTVAAKAGADAPGGGISLCFCRRGCAAPAKQAATLNAPPNKPPRSTPRQTSRPAQRPAILNEKARLNIAEGGQSLCLPDFFK